MKWIILGTLVVIVVCEYAIMDNARKADEQAAELYKRYLKSKEKEDGGVHSER